MKNVMYTKVKMQVREAVCLTSPLSWSSWGSTPQTCNQYWDMDVKVAWVLWEYLVSVRVRLSQPV